MSLRSVAAAHPSSSSLPVFLIAIELLPEQVIALKIVRDCHIAGTPLVLFPLLRQFHIVLADFRVLDRKRRVRRGFGKVLTLLLLRLTPNYVGHIGGLVHRHFAILSEAIDDLAHLAPDPSEHGMKLDLGSFSTLSGHTFLLVLL